MERANVVAAYDHLEDAIVFNADHPAWADMRGFMKSGRTKGFYSTAHPQHIVRHELGHAAHYRALSLAGAKAHLVRREPETTRDVDRPKGQRPGGLEPQGVRRRSLRWPLGRGGL